MIVNHKAMPPATYHLQNLGKGIRIFSDCLKVVTLLEAIGFVYTSVIKSTPNYSMMGYIVGTGFLWVGSRTISHYCLDQAEESLKGFNMQNSFDQKISFQTFGNKKMYSLSEMSKKKKD